MRRAIERSGYTQTALADALSVSEGQVSRWVRGKALPEGQSMVRLPGLLNVNGHYLLTGEGPEDVRPPGDAERRLRLVRIAVEADDVAAVVRLLDMLGGDDGNG